MEKKRLIEITELLIDCLKNSTAYQFKEHTYNFRFMYKEERAICYGICDLLECLFYQEDILYYEPEGFKQAIKEFQYNRGGKTFGYWFPTDERTIERRLEFLRDYLEYLKK